MKLGSFIFYDSQDERYKSPFGAVATESSTTFTVVLPVVNENVIEHKDSGENCITSDNENHINNENYTVTLHLCGLRRVFETRNNATQNESVQPQNGVEYIDGYAYERYSESIPLKPQKAVIDSLGIQTQEYKGVFFAPKKPLRLDYYFEIVCTSWPAMTDIISDSCSFGSQSGQFFYGNNLTGTGGIGEFVNSQRQVSPYVLTVYDKHFQTPNWFKNAVMYQVFPDRFWNGNENGDVFVKQKERDAQEYKVYTSWFEPMDANYGYDDRARGERRIRNDFYGGNLKGILDKANYLRELGVNTLYLNPIFEAYSNHRYDTGDFLTVDPMIGTNQEFKETAKKLGTQGVRIILDGVFNHTGSDSLYFNKYGKYDSVGAYQSKDSPYADWYTFHDFDNNRDSYECWWGITNVPSVNKKSQTYKKLIFGDQDINKEEDRAKNAGVVKYWLQEGANGWRLDVADELPSDFLMEIREQAKLVNPDAVIIGEVWDDAATKYSYGEQREYFLGKQLDSVMNYPFYDAVTAFAAGKNSGADVMRTLNAICENYPPEALASLMNIIGTHDKPRALTVLNGETNRMKLAIVAQMTFVGVPCIYYGDEVGMCGGADPLNRAAFPWNGPICEDLLQFYKKIIKFRISRKELIGSGINLMFGDGNVFVFERFTSTVDVTDKADNANKSDNANEAGNANKSDNANEAGNAKNTELVIVLNNSKNDWCNFELDLNETIVGKRNMDAKASVGYRQHPNLQITPVFGMCYLNPPAILSVPPLGGGIFEICVC